MSTEASQAARAADSPKALGEARWIGFMTIIIREYGRIIRIWAQTIVPSAVTSALYFVIFGSLIGRRVGLMEGVPYMQFIAPGLIMMAVITKTELLSIILGGLFFVEAVSVITQVVSFKLFKKRVFLMAPIHHHFEKKGWPEPRIIVRFWIISVLLALVALSSLKLR